MENLQRNAVTLIVSRDQKLLPPNISKVIFLHSFILLHIFLCSLTSWPWYLIYTTGMGLYICRKFNHVGINLHKIHRMDTTFGHRNWIFTLWRSPLTYIWNTSSKSIYRCGSWRQDTFLQWNWDVTLWPSPSTYTSKFGMQNIISRVYTFVPSPLMQSLSHQYDHYISSQSQRNLHEVRNNDI